MTPWMSRSRCSGPSTAGRPDKERHHHPVDESQGGGCLIFDQCRVPVAFFGGVPLRDDVAGERVEALREPVEACRQRGVTAGKQQQLVARLGAGQPGFGGRVHHDAGQTRGAGELRRFIPGEFGHQRQVGDIEFVEPSRESLQQRLAGPEVERCRAGRHPRVFVNLGVADAVDPVGAQQLLSRRRRAVGAARARCASYVQQCVQSRTGRSWVRWAVR